MEHFPMCGLKKQKLQKEPCIVETGEKSIGDLPDTVLQRILSLLPTKDAVKTSVLCKRWEYLWTSIPNLVFDELPKPKRKHFMDFVERVIVLHEPYKIEKFSLACDVFYDASRINSWISAAIRRKVSDVFLSFSNFKEPFALPRCLFDCETLEGLGIELSGSLLKLPPFICFSSLRVLNLCNVMFSDENSTQQLFSCCPILEELSLEECDWRRLKVVSICPPKLLKLDIRELDGDSKSDCQFIIFGNKLTHFTYAGQFLNDYSLYNFSILNEAEIDVYGCCYNRHVASRAYKLLIGLSSVNRLTISAEVLQVLDEAAELRSYLPIFNNLTHLVLEFSFADFDYIAFWMMLQNCPCLRTLTFGEGISASLYKKLDQILNPVPSCFLSKLKSIKVYGYKGEEDEVHAVRMLLENALALDKLFIYCSSDSQKAKEGSERLLALPRGSDNCEIVFI